VYDSLYHVEEAGGVLRFYGYAHGSQTYASLDRTGHFVGTGSAEAAALVHILHMEPEEGQEFELGFYSPSSQRFLILRAHRTATGGFYYVAYCDGTQWFTTPSADLPWFTDPRPWRILYDAQDQRFQAWVDGHLVAQVESFSLQNYYPYFAATDTDVDPNDSVEIHVDQFQYLDFQENDGTTRYVPAGMYLTAPQDAGTYVAFHRLRWSAQTPPGTACKLQLRTASTLQNLQTAPWQGPQGPDTYFTGGTAPVPWFHDGHRWFQIRVLLSSTDSLQTPTLDSLVLTWDSLAVIQGDSGGIQLPQEYPAAVHYDAEGHRSVLVRFYPPQSSAGNLWLSSAVHPEQHYAMTNGIHRWWNLHTEGIYDSLDLTLFYQPEDLPPNLSEPDLWAWRWDGNQWTSWVPDSLDTLSNAVQCRGIPALSQWTLASEGATRFQENPPHSATVGRILYAQRQAWLDLTHGSPGPVLVEIFNVSGQRLWHRQQTLPAGRHRWALPSGYPAGVYFLRISLPQHSPLLLRWAWTGRG